jgi:hypothetical protein
MIEVQLVNSVAPLYYAIASEVMKKDNTGQKTYYQRLAMEGKFHRFLKKHHPHTNMAKSGARKTRHKDTDNFLLGRRQNHKHCQNRT